MTTILAPVVTFALYAIITAARKNQSLFAAKAFTSLTLITLLAGPIMNLTQALPALAGGLSSLGRIESFMKTKSRGSNDRRSVESNSGDDLELSRILGRGDMRRDVQAQEPVDLPAKSEKISIVVRNGKFAWATNAAPSLYDINLEIQAHSLTLMVGAVGSGKSTLILGLLKEIPEFEGLLDIDRSSIAYCAQIPWLTNVSIRKNIIGPLDFDAAWYSEVIKACALQADFEHMVNVDFTSVGSKGISLSRGQKQRIVSFPPSPFFGLE
jgi:ATP-binding cassette subfamily C (CFTR/MRP) protein 1